MYMPPDNFWQGTCSLDYPKDMTVTFARTEKYLQRIMYSSLYLQVFTTQELYEKYKHDVGVNIELIPCGDPEYEFILKHNEIYRDATPAENMIFPTADIHPMASVGNEGMRYVRCGLDIISMKHMGSVIISSGVTVGACSTIARATLDFTMIEENVKIGCGVHIGHNCRIGARSILIDGVVVGGSTHIGEDCYIGLNATVRGGLKIASNVLIGMGSVVSKDISSSGVYVGVPARRIKDWNGKWPT